MIYSPPSLGHLPEMVPSQQATAAPSPLYGLHVGSRYMPVAGPHLLPGVNSFETTFQLS